MQFKADRQKTEFNGLELDGRVRAIALELDFWLTLKHKKQMFVTGVKREAAEQAAIYPDNPTKSSPHVITSTNPLVRAVDFRRAHLVPAELITLVGYFNQNWGRFNLASGNPYAILLVDDQGPTVPHLHLANYAF